MTNTDKADTLDGHSRKPSEKGTSDLTLDYLFFKLFYKCTCFCNIKGTVSNAIVPCLFISAVQTPHCGTQAPLAVMHRLHSTWAQ